MFQHFSSYELTNYHKISFNYFKWFMKEFVRKMNHAYDTC